MSGQAGRGYLPALDGIRAVAVAAVVAVHLALYVGIAPNAPGWLSHTSGGQLGVDVFFVLSGALITSLLLGEHGQSGAISLSAFYVRRLRRLGPALVLTVAAMIVVASTYGLSALGPHPALTAAVVLGFAGNWLSAHALGSLGWLAPTWSLAVEEQFYLTWPLVLRAAMRFRIRARDVALTLFLALVCCQAYGLVVLNHTAPQRAYFHTPVRGVGLVVGCLVALLVRFAPTHVLARLMRNTAVASVAGIGVFVVAHRYGSDVHALVSGGYLLVDSLAAVVIAHCLLRAQDRSVVTRILSSRPLVGLGVISYGVYLYHVPVILGVVYAGRGHLTPAQQIAVDIAATLAAATASYFLVERPIRRRRRPATTTSPMPRRSEAVASAIVVD